MIFGFDDGIEILSEEHLTELHSVYGKHSNIEDLIVFYRFHRFKNNTSVFLKFSNNKENMYLTVLNNKIIVGFFD